jgi:hypothetical protein
MSEDMRYVAATHFEVNSVVACSQKFFGDPIFPPKLAPKTNLTLNGTTGGSTSQDD